MTIILPTDKIKGRHRDRLAIVYIRQSTLQQVGHNQESTRLQYGLVDRVQQFGWACRQDAGAQLFGHRLHITDIEIEFAGDLLVGQVQAHEVKAQDPDPQRLMMTGEDGLGQVIEAHLAGRAAVALALSLPVIVTIPRHLVTPALRAAHTRGPA